MFRYVSVCGKGGGGGNCCDARIGIVRIVLWGAHEGVSYRMFVPGCGASVALERMRASMVWSRGGGMEGGEWRPCCVVREEDTSGHGRFL